MIAKLLIILIGSLLLSLWLCKRYGILYRKAPVIALIVASVSILGYLFFRSATNLFIVTLRDLWWAVIIIGIILVLVTNRLRTQKS